MNIAYPYNFLCMLKRDNIHRERGLGRNYFNLKFSKDFKRSLDELHNTTIRYHRLPTYKWSG